ncbi:ABC transporter substrate-binding protein [Nocardia sp. NPDC060249]|uniref:ABC transporter substrate-binding protein n=1 Tax=Nocardia sp. NPDC060249 TaxID=3347082 RepID=UPI00366777CD
MNSHHHGRKAGWGIVLVAVTTLLAACGQNSSAPVAADDPVTITFLSYTYGQTNPLGKGIEKLINDFQTANPKITVKPQSVPTADALTKLQSEVVAGNPPDVAQIGWSKVAQASQTLPLRSLEEVAGTDEWNKHMAGFVPSVLKATPVAGAKKPVAMPFMMATPVVFYNADLFTAAGLDPAQPPKTMAQLKQAAQAIKDKTEAQGVYVSAVDPGKSDYLTQSLVNSAGGALVSSSGEVTVDSAPVITALSTIQDLTKSGVQPAVDFASAQSAFNSGKLGMLVTTGGGLLTLDAAAKGKFALQVAPLPAFDNLPARPTFSGSGLTVVAKDAAKAKAAWKFVQYMTNDESFKLIASQMGYLPLRTAAESSADPRLGSAVKQMADLVPYTAFPGKQSNQGVVILQDDAVEPIVLRGADPTATLRAAAAKIRGLN